jgi:hypothetical protein
MKNAFIMLFAFIILSCSPNEQKTEETISENIGTEDSQMTEETVRVFGSDQPGAEPKEFDMRILKGHEAWNMVEPGNSDVQEDELVIGMMISGKPVAVPIRHMSGFEVSNLDINGESYLVTWCPLVGSARLFEGKVNGEEADFDFGMGLVDNNLTIVDRETNTVWGQLSCKSIGGELTDTQLMPLPSIQTTWAYWKENNPGSQVLVNSDTSGAVFPQWVNENPIYTSWIPGEEYRPTSGHDLTYVGLGYANDDASVFFDLANLFEKDSPMEVSVGDENILVYADKAGLTAWAESPSGELLPGTIVYEWAWKNFYPDAQVY